MCARRPWGHGTAPDEPHGGKIIGGTRITVHSGHYLEIPAGVPHQVTSVSAKFSFVVFKSRQQGDAAGTRVIDR